MTREDYERELREDAYNYLLEHYTYLADDMSRDELLEKVQDDAENGEMYDFCWIADQVTGNGSGSYYFNAYKAEEAVCHCMDLWVEAEEEFGSDCPVWRGAEIADVTIRCYLLSQVDFEEIAKELQEEIENW